MRALSEPFSARPVGTTAVASTLRMPASRATTRRAPDRGRSVVRRDQNVTAVVLGSPVATPSRNAPGPTRARRGFAALPQAGGTAANAPAAVAETISSRLETWSLLIGA